MCVFRGVYILSIPLNEDAFGAECGRLEAFKTRRGDGDLVEGGPQASRTVAFSSMLEVARSLHSG